MNFKYLSLILILFFDLGCGVKGDPLPPLQPPELGRGRPTYKGATEGLKIQLEEENEEEEEEEE